MNTICCMMIELYALCNVLCALLIFICRKYEEIYPPDVSEFVYITDDTYTKQQVWHIYCMLVTELMP